MSTNTQHEKLLTAQRLIREARDDVEHTFVPCPTCGTPRYRKWHLHLLWQALDGVYNRLVHILEKYFPA